MNDIKSRYIFPNLQELLENGKTQTIDEISKLYEPNFTLVLSDAGLGKSRLLREVVNNAPENGYEACWLDLKHISERESVEESIQKLSKQKNQQSVFHSSPNFDLGKEKGSLIFCLDSLDEVSVNEQFNIIKKVNFFRSSFPKAKILLSCRTDIFQQFKHLFQDIPSLKRIEVKRLDFARVKIFIKENLNREFITWTDKDWSDLHDKFARDFSGYPEVIDSPRMLELFVELGKEKGLKNVMVDSKADLMEQFVNFSLESELKEGNQFPIHFLKTVLGKLALVMQVLQVSKISKKDFSRFLMDIEPSLVSLFSSTNDLLTLYSKTLLQVRNNDLEFRNAEFMEYLASKEIEEYDKPLQATFDLVIDDETKEFIPSWYNTIAYLAELDIEFQQAFVNFIRSRKNHLDMDLIDKVLPTYPARIEELKEEEKSAIFKIILAYYRNTDRYIYTETASKLANYYQNSNEQELKEDILSDKWQPIASAFTVVSYVKSQEKVIDEEFWIEHAVDNIKHRSEPQIRENAILTLGSFKNTALLKSRERELELSTAQDDKHFVNAFKKADENSEFTLQRIVDMYLKKRHGIHPYPRIQIDSEEGLRNIIKVLMSIDKSRLRRNTDIFDYLRDYNEFFLQLETHYSSQLQDELIKFIIRLCNNEFYTIMPFVKVGISKNPSFEGKLLEETLERMGYWSWSENEHSFLMRIDDFVSFLKNAEISIEETIIILNELIRIKSKNVELSELVKTFPKTLKPYFEYSNEEIKREGKSYANNRRDDKTNDFVEALTIGNCIKIIDSICDDYIEEWKNDYQEEIKEIVLRGIHNVDENKLNTVKSSDGTANMEFIEFSHAIELANLFNIDLSKVRSILLRTLAYCINQPHHYYNTEEHIENLEPFKEEELNYFFDFYEEGNQKNYNLYSSVSAFNTIIYSQQSTQAVIAKATCIFENFLVNEYHKVKVNEGYFFESIVSLNQNFKLVHDLFKKSSGKSESNLNQILVQHISEYQEEAIDWRIEQIKGSAKKIKNEDLKYAFESDKFDNADVSIKTVVGIKHHLKLKSLLKFSLSDLFWESSGYRSYQRFVWRIVFDFYHRSKQELTYEIISELESKIQKHKSKDDNLKFLFEDVKRSYLSTNKRFKKIVQAVKKANKIRSNDYLEVASTEELFMLLKRVLETEIRRLIEQEGYYQTVQRVTSKQEDTIQKTLTILVENALLRSGLRPNEVVIYREAQLAYDKRTDFLISYGFLEPILVEIKRTENPEIHNEDKREEYKSKMYQYVEGMNAKHGLYLVFQTTKKYEIDKFRPLLKEQYADTVVDVIGFNCVLGS